MPKPLSNNYQVDVALMKADIASLKTDVSDIKKDLKDFIRGAPSTFYPRTEAEARLKAIEDKISENKTAIGKFADWTAKYGPVIILLGWILLGKVI